MLKSTYFHRKINIKDSSVSETISILLGFVYMCCQHSTTKSLAFYSFHLQQITLIYVLYCVLDHSNPLFLCVRENETDNMCGKVFCFFSPQLSAEAYKKKGQNKRTTNKNKVRVRRLRACVHYVKVM